MSLSLFLVLVSVSESQWMNVCMMNHTAITYSPKEGATA